MLITGGSGRLGRELVKRFPDALYPTHAELDLERQEDVNEYLAETKPECIIHCAALTDVRQCENERSKAWATNVLATENLVKACQTNVGETFFVYMSTACVFRGDTGDYSETDIPYPDNFYSLTKLLGEFVVKKLNNYLIIRANFVPREKWKYERAFVDRFGTYLFADDLSLAMKKIINSHMTGIVHIAGDEKISMYDLAKLTTPGIEPMNMKDIDLPLPRDMSLRSVRIEPFELTRK